MCQRERTTLSNTHFPCVAATDDRRTSSDKLLDRGVINVYLWNGNVFMPRDQEKAQISRRKRPRVVVVVAAAVAAVATTIYVFG